MTTITHHTHDIRLQALRQLQERKRLDAVALFSEQFIEFYTHFHVDVATWERPIVAVLPGTSAGSFAILNELSTNHVRIARERNSLWIDEVEFYAEHPRLQWRLPLLSQLPEQIAARLEQAGLARSRIGVDANSPLLARVSALLPDVRFIPINAELRQQRYVKTDEELTVLREAASLADWAQERYRERLRPGVNTQVLDLEIAAQVAAEASRRHPGEHLGIFTWSLSGARSASPHGDGVSLGTLVEQGDTIITIVIPRLNGLVVENERTWFAGKPSVEQARYFEVARAANQAAIDNAVAGRPVSGIDAAAQHVIEQAGLGQYIHHRTGHGIGILGHEYPEDMAFNHRPLLKNEVYSAEPGIYVYGLGGFRLDDIVIIGDGAAEVLTRTPKARDYATLG